MGCGSSTLLPSPQAATSPSTAKTAHATGAFHSTARVPFKAPGATLPSPVRAPGAYTRSPPVLWPPMTPAHPPRAATSPSPERALQITVFTKIQAPSRRLVTSRSTAPARATEPPTLVARASTWRWATSPSTAPAPVATTGACLSRATKCSSPPPATLPSPPAAKGVRTFTAS